MFQCMQHLVVRGEIGIGEIYVGSGVDYCRYQSDINQAEAFGYAPDYPDDLTALLVELGKIIARFERRPLLIIPLRNEYFLKLRHRGTLYLDVGVAPIL